MHAARRIRLALVASIALFASGCGDGSDEGDARSTQGATAEALPAPEGVRGSVTGMPDAREGRVLDGAAMTADDALAALPPDTAIDSDGNVILPNGSTFNGETSMPGSMGTGPADGMAGDPAGDAEAMSSRTVTASPGPGAQQAVAVMRAYFDAINRGQHDVAHALWADDGRASGQSPAQFAGGLAGTSALAADIMEPGRIDRADGARYIEVPVAYSTTTRDGRQRRFVGAYTLRHAPEGSAGGAPGQWRIASADLQEVRP
ncbi:hypothetical protein [Lysobacter sp. A3-1-A15]|uniref:hypothetical protein n=1 Tax=Novilysobacter viscosus TaxID=3098602 RepID=UPI002EDA5B49